MGKFSIWLKRKSHRGCSVGVWVKCLSVATEDGDKPISALKVGDKVYAYNEELGAVGLYTVTAVLATIKQLRQLALPDFAALGEVARQSQYAAFATGEPQRVIGELLAARKKVNK